MAIAITKAHEEFKEKKFEFEASWITRENGFQHKIIDFDVRQQALDQAQNLIEEED